MKGLVYLILLIFTLNSCGSGPEEDGGMITSSGGEEEETDSSLIQTDSVEYDLSAQPLPIFYFFKLTNDQIGTDFCYDEAQVKNLLMGDGPDEFTWISKDVGNSYLTFENNECFVTTEFSFFTENERTFATLIQSSKGAQEIGIFAWNEGGQIWHELDFYPQPKNEDFYADLSPSDNELVREYGKFFALMSDNGSRISFYYSTWQMGLNADGKEIMDFNKQPDFSFELMFDAEDGFWLKKVYENKKLIPKRYFLAYSETGEISDDFTFFSDRIGEQLKEDRVESAYADFSETNYKGIFAGDTFDFSSMQQFEPRNGFWFYERGKEPLDLEYDMVESTLKKARRYFYEL